MKQILLVLVLLIAILACNKKEKENRQNAQLATKNAQVRNTQTVKSHAKILRRIVNYLGTSFQVTYRDGCYSLHEEYYQNGNIKSRDITCSGTCKFCDVVGVVRVGNSIIIKDDNGNNGLNVSTSQDLATWQGIVSLAEDGGSMVFAVDKTKISSDLYNSVFASDYLTLENGYMINDEILHEFNLSWDQQFIPAGEYELFQDDNIIFWVVQL